VAKGGFRVYYVGGVKRSDACERRTVEVEDRVTMVQAREYMGGREEYIIRSVSCAL